MIPDNKDIAPGITDQQRIIRFLGPTGHLTNEQLEEMTKEKSKRGRAAAAVLRMRKLRPKKLV